MLKFNDEQIKAAFEKRTLRPSDNAWMELQGQLNNIQKPAPKKNRWWLLAAAGLLLPLAWYGLFGDFSNNPTNVVSQPIAEKKEINHHERENVQDFVTAENTAPSTTIAKDKKSMMMDNIKQQTTDLRPSPNRGKAATALTEEGTVGRTITSTDEVQPSNESQNDIKKIKNAVAAIDTEVDQLLSRAQSSLEESVRKINDISDETIAEMLQKAQRQLSAEEEVTWLMAEILAKKTEGQLQAESLALLAEVENDLNQNIYSKIYFAVATRLDKFKESIKKS